MFVEVSIGEVIDKYSILEIKKVKIGSKDKQRDIEKEMEVLRSCKEYINRYPFFYKLLVWVNTMIWETTDHIKEIQPTHSEFSNLAYSIFEMNQVRFRLKKYFNSLCSSNIHEHKSYAESHCVIHIDNEDDLYRKIPEINYLCISYDTVSFTYSDMETIRSIFKNPNIIYNTKHESAIQICIDSYFIPDTYKNVFSFDPFIYVCTGMLGDLVHQLSVIYEKFRETGKKGKLYLYGAEFSTGLMNTYNDTYDIIVSQNYMDSYYMVEEGVQLSSYDYNLSEWRYSNLLYKTNWNNIYNSLYNIKWASHKWLNLPIDDTWKDMVVISSSIFRFIPSINYNKIYETYKEKLIYVTQNVNEYYHFISRVGIDIPLYTPATLQEYWTILNSCEKYIGNLSSPLAVRIALYKPAEILIDKSHTDSIHMLELQNNIPNITYNYN